MAFGESRAKQAQDDKPLTIQRLVRPASVDMASGAIRRIAGIVGERSPQLGRCFRSFPPLRASPLGLSDSGPGMMQPLLIPDTLFKGPSRQKNQAKNAMARPRYHKKWLIASADQFGYIGLTFAGTPSARRPCREHIGTPERFKPAPGFSRALALPSQQLQLISQPEDSHA
jgi:hypothetical protein